MKRWQTILIGVVISAIALYFAFRQANLAEIIDAFREARYEYIAMGIPIVMLTIVFRGWRWSVLTQGRLSFWDGYWLFNVGFLFNNVLPARLGEIARSILAGRRPRMHFTSALSSVVVERLFDMVSVGVLIGMILLVLDLPSWATTAGAVMGGGAFIGIIVLALAARFPTPALKIGSRILSLAPSFDAKRAEQFLAPFIHGLAGVSDWRIFFGGLLLSLIAWVISGVAAWVLMFAFFPSANLIDGMLTVAAAGLGIAIPAAPSGIGPFEAAVIGALSAVGYDADLSRSYALTLHILNFLITSVLGVIGLAREGVSFSEVARAAESAKVDSEDTPPDEDSRE